MYDPILHMDIAERHLAELRAEAAVRRQVARGVPRWRRIAGRAMVAAGRRLLAEPPAPVTMRPARECE
jgi:hypothetical protein